MKTHLGSPHRPRIMTLALAAILAAAALGLSQCKMVDDTVTGVDVTGNGVLDRKDSACEHRCSHDYRSCRRKEDHRYEQAKRECRRIKDSDDRMKCRKEAERRHEAMKQACKAAKNKCKAACHYHEGSGKGGD